jgi:DNA-binding CsgD family transcriptional regulator/tetratricopeptide (TPR) repeat protein
VVFRHPLVRSAVYRSASDDDRRAVHRAIADVTDPDTDPDHRAWHRAAASADPDEEVAAELERSAERAQARGGLSAAAAFLERATTLTPDLERRARRALAAAHSRLMVGSPDAACRLAAIAEAGPLEPLERARLELLRAKTAVYPTYRATAPQLLVTAARRLAPLDAALCRETYLDAIQAATSAGSLGETGQLRAVAEAALAAPPAPEPPRAVDLFLDGLATRVVDGEAAGVPLLRRALIAFRGETDQRWLWLVIRTTQAIGDDETWHVLVNRQIQVARQTGTLVMLPIALRQLAVLQVYSGRLDDAEATNEEADAIGAAIGVRPVAYGRLALTAWRGRLQKTTPLVDHTISESTTRGEGLAVAAAYQAMAVQYIGLSRYEEAMETALKASSSNEAGYAMLSLPDVIEAAVRTNNCEVATAAMEPLSSIAQAMGTNWALGVVARSRALMSDDRGEIECLHEEAIARLGQTRVVVELARAHLLYGEWLRRQRRRMDARAHLRVAHDMFVAMGAEAFADRVVRELEATGEHARRRSPETTNQLTPQQIQVARLACAGHSNSEIAAQLFISPRTVEYHLRNVYLSLGVTSRGQLAGFLN